MRNSNSNDITREYFDRILLETRYIDADIASTKMPLWGKTFDTPIMTAALSHMDTTCENGMVKYALGAKAVNAVHFIGMGDLETAQNVYDTGVPTVKIIKPYMDRSMIDERLEHALENGAFAVGIDIDHAFNYKGGYDHVIDWDQRPISSKELKELVRRAGDTPFVIKGVLSVQDALRCQEAGVKGILVSHHHSIMEYSVPPLMALPKIRKAVGDSMKIFVDCCIETGMDAFKALALGADAVGVGQHLIPYLRDEGAEGVARRMGEMTGELQTVMNRTGFRTLDEIDDSVIWMRNF